MSRTCLSSASIRHVWHPADEPSCVSTLTTRLEDILQPQWTSFVHFSSKEYICGQSESQIIQLPDDTRVERITMQWYIVQWLACEGVLEAGPN